jgi:uncharacterized integral membrane protein
MDFMLRVSGPSGSELLQDATRHIVASQTAADRVVLRARGSILIPQTLTAESTRRRKAFLRGFVSFRAGWDKDDTMTSNTPASPGERPAKPAQAPKSGATSPEPAIGFTRAGALWTSLIAGFLILILLLIFIAQNTTSTPFTFVGLHWNLPLGVAILLAAVGGGLLTVAVGTARIIQLRRAAKKHHAAASRQPSTHSRSD